ncbi:MAG: alpha-ketoacid dehydrogenase subunit beta, partial [SAR202 cluster bacterium]|nr:alpha-ketoacid dehydrogenase subunit beta [SAR202 cluster bacterium]
MGEMRLIEAVRQGLREELAADSSVFLIGQDIGVNGGVFRVTDGLLDEFGPERVIDSPLAESGMVGVAIGAAMNGLRPVVEVQFADFIFPAFNQIVSEAARMYYRTNGDYSVPIVIRAPYGGGVRGGLYHSQSVEAYFAHVPGLKVVVPSNPHDAKGLLKAAIRDNNPVLFFEHKLAYNTVQGDVPEGNYTVPIGKAAVRREGQQLSLISYGLSVHHCLEAAETLAAEGISCEVVDLRSVSPLDTKTLLESVKKTGRVCIVHEDNLTGGVGAEVAAIVAKDAFEYLDAPVQRVAALDV